MSARSIRNKKKQDATKMYRHFAVVTVAATAVLAMFADGESRQVLTDQMQAAAREAPHNDKLGETKLVRKDPHAANTASNSAFYAEGSSDYGEPMDTAGAAAGDSGVEFQDEPRPTIVPEGFNLEFGMSEDELAELTPQQRKELLEAIRKRRAGVSKSERARQIEQLKAASQARAGAPSEDSE